MTYNLLLQLKHPQFTCLQTNPYNPRFGIDRITGLVKEIIHHHYRHLYFRTDHELAAHTCERGILPKQLRAGFSLFNTG